MYDPSETEIGLVIVLQLGICILLLAELVDGVQGYDTLIGLGGKLVGTVMVFGAVILLFRRRQLRTGV